MTYQVKNRFQSLPFKCNLQRYAAGAVPALTELRLKGNDRLTSVSEMMLKGLGMMRKGVTVVR
jgi:hypothetical protein